MAGAANGQPSVPVRISLARVLNTKGWAASIQAQLKVGDYLQVGKRLHLVIAQDVDSDDQGNATINIWPSIREAPNDGNPIILNNPTESFGDCFSRNLEFVSNFGLQRHFASVTVCRLSSWPRALHSSCAYVAWRTSCPVVEVING